MPTESIDTAVRMVGHLLEHNGITGPFFADKDGNKTNAEDPSTCGYCLLGAIETVSYRLGFSKGYWQGNTLVMAVRTVLGCYGLVAIWEGGRPEQRLAIARRLQCYGI